MDALDKHYPPCGPCGFCGHKDKRHRLWDAMMSRRAAGEASGDIADDLSVTPEHMAAVIEARPYAQRHHFTELEQASRREIDS